MSYDNKILSGEQWKFGVEMNNGDKTICNFKFSIENLKFFQKYPDIIFITF